MGTRKTFLEQGLRTNNKFNALMYAFTSTVFKPGIHSSCTLEGACCHSPKCYSTTLVLPSNQILGIIFIKPINNRWAWGMVPEEGGATRHAEPIAQGIHDNLWAGTTRHHHTEYQWKLKYLPHAYHAKRDGRKSQAVNMWAPVCKPQPPHILILEGKLLANIASCLTYPKLHL